MGKKIIKSNFRVVIEPRRIGQYRFGSISEHAVMPDADERAREYQSRCEAIEADVRRHVDGFGSVSVECDSETVCEHCGSAWTERGNYNGGCCSKDEEAREAALDAGG